MSDEKALEVKPDLSLSEYGSRQDIAVFAERLRAMLPGGDKLSPTGAMALAQYAIAMDANPFRGEVYAWVDWQGKLVLDEGYKLMVRWAKRQCAYSEKFEPMPADQIADGDIGSVCWILRQDSMPMLSDLIKAGMPYREAFEIVASKAVGVVTAQEMVSHKTGKPINAPTGWTWLQVAEKRALKNALNRSHGAPSPKEIAAETWKVGDIETIADDWETVKPEMRTAEAEAEAAYNAQIRVIESEPPSVTAEEASETLFDL